MSQRSAVYFPPRILSDLILHYRDVDFHVHKLVLYQHCDYFRAFVLTLQPAAASAPVLASASASASTAAAGNHAAQQTVSSSSSPSSSLSSPTTNSSSAWAAVKRSRTSELLSSEPGSAPSAVEDECSHSPPVACTQLPDSFGVARAEPWALQLFLEHVYLPSAHPFPPYVPKVRVDLSTIERDAELPLFPTPDAAAIARYVTRDAQGNNRHSRSLLSLIHYFHAERLWQQSLAVIRAVSTTPSHAWIWLSIVSRYGLKEEEDRLIQQVANDKAVSDSEPYRTVAASVSVSVWLRLVQVMHSRKR